MSAPIRSLDARYYTDPAVFEAERAGLLACTWQFAGHASQLEKPGDYFTVDLGGESLFCVRGRDGEIRTFYNVCQHRAHELVKGNGNCKLVVCPYHAWTYGLDGKLIGAPRMEGAEGFEKDEHNLPVVRAETWGGFVFVNFDPDAVSLLHSLGDIPERFAKYNMEDMRVTRKWENRFNANWKVWVENSREGYHVPTIHSESLNTFYPGYKFSGFTAVGDPGKYMINSSDIETGLYVPRDATLPFIEGLDEHDTQQTHFMIHYPSLLLNVPPDRITFHQYFPDGPQWTRITTWCCFPKSTVELENFAVDVEEKYYPQMKMFIDEDKGVCEIVQRGLNSPMTELGRFSPAEESTVYDFSNWVLDKVVGPAT